MKRSDNRKRYKCEWTYAAAGTTSLSLTLNTGTTLGAAGSVHIDGMETCSMEFDASEEMYEL